MICGLQKMTLLDFPGKVACTVFLGGCNFRCPFCHNSDLLKGSSQNVIEKEEFFEFLASRKGKLDGVCITGGEPLLQPDTVEFIKEIRSLGFLVKLDTNGSFYEKLQYIIENKLCDYVAMDVKNSLAEYRKTTASSCDEVKIKESIEMIKDLLDSICSMNARVVNIAATTEEISAQSDTIRDLSDGIQGEVNAI